MSFMLTVKICCVSSAQRIDCGYLPIFPLGHDAPPALLFKIPETIFTQPTDIKNYYSQPSWWTVWRDGTPHIAKKPHSDSDLPN
jgi:hypothetical protein